jgi:hypothetical protein
MSQVMPAEFFIPARFSALARHTRLWCLPEEFPKTKTAEQLDALLPWNAKATVDAGAAQTDAELAA